MRRLTDPHNVNCAVQDHPLDRLKEVVAVGVERVGSRPQSTIDKLLFAYTYRLLDMLGQKEEEEHTDPPLREGRRVAIQPVSARQRRGVEKVHFF